MSLRLGFCMYCIGTWTHWARIVRDLTYQKSRNYGSISADAGCIPPTVGQGFWSGLECTG